MKKGVHLKRFKSNFLHYPTKQQIQIFKNGKKQIFTLQPNKVVFLKLT